jgi:endogenous inhibitor of DNA gyrase (YacG/DUF329 family)
MPKLVCPTCRKEATYQTVADVPFFPFCSRRCQWIDLGKWLNEEYRLSEELPLELEDEAPRRGPRSEPGK